MGGRRARCAMQEGRGEQREAGSWCSSGSVFISVSQNARLYHDHHHHPSPHLFYFWVSNMPVALNAWENKREVSFDRSMGLL